MLAQVTDGASTQDDEEHAVGIEKDVFEQKDDKNEYADAVEQGQRIGEPHQILQFDPQGLKAAGTQRDTMLPKKEQNLLPGRSKKAVPGIIDDRIAAPFEDKVKERNHERDADAAKKGIKQHRHESCQAIIPILVHHAPDQAEIGLAFDISFIYHTEDK